MMRGFRHTGAKDVPPCGPAGEVIRQPAASPDGRWIVHGRPLALQGGVDGDHPAAVIILFAAYRRRRHARVRRRRPADRVRLRRRRRVGWDICDVGTEGGDAADLTHGAAGRLGGGAAEPLTGRPLPRL
ncbi:MAG: hypothetical protein U0470_02170 [Anaerolineae bacterium]